MEYSWFMILLSLCLCAAATNVFLILFSQSKSKKTKLSLPPGPPSLPIVGSIFLLKRLLTDFESLIRDLSYKYGPIISIRIGSSLSVFISSHSLAHQALIQNGAAFSYRPGSVTPSCIFRNTNSDTGSSSGARWRFLRRNLTSALLSPSRYKCFGRARISFLETVDSLLKYHVESGDPVPVVEPFRYAMFSLLLFMCFGEKLDEKAIKDIVEIEGNVVANYKRLSIFHSFPTFGKFIFRKHLIDIRRKQISALLPLIQSRRERKEKIKQENQDENIFAYIDSLFDLKFKDEGGRDINDEEIVILICEVMDAGSDTVSTVFEWVMAHLVKDQTIQEKLFSEIQQVVNSEEEIKEEDLQKMPYLKAVVLETLRLNPPSHFVLPRIVEEDVVLNGYLIPKKTIVNFTVAGMGRDPQVWKDPMEFKPERFLGEEGEVVDITGTREIKMMPFSAGRRICPGLGLGTLHLEYFLANLIRNYKWVAVDGQDVDMSEKQEFTWVMKTPLRAHVSQRAK
ncbi:cytochrome P450 89A2-like [Macadamia integrifolia]|uniref:cytochrome P450 89A2-like n=1 Tax=Macadamia integrifolia TaxID=60698 RepID=UPI001C4F08ED|nr:cytochrome P450 89A2-like [Macadamia integrifolia]XP_042487032.1 cytochrome P450 89A2-like [Macadamia integrifolia]